MAIHLLDAMVREGFEQVIAIHDARSGLRAFLAIHDTSSGPAFGGIRRFVYRDEKTGLIDCLRLSKAMSLKCALAGLPAGGAKMVIFDAPGLDLEAGYRYIGRFVEGLVGQYYAGPDVGTGWDQLRFVGQETDHVAREGDRGAGDLAGATAAGVFAGMAAALRHVDGAEAWAERSMVIQGLGSVGWCLAERLCKLGCRVFGVDLEEAVSERARRELGVEVLQPGSEMSQVCDVFAPCAMGGVLHDLSIQRLRARIVCGAANNPIARSVHAQVLHDRGVLYMPDFVINSGAVIMGVLFHKDGSNVSLNEIEARVGDTTNDILSLAAKKDSSPFLIAQYEAERRIAAARGRRSGSGATSSTLDS